MALLALLSTQIPVSLCRVQSKRYRGMLYKYVYDGGGGWGCSVNRNKLKLGPFPEMCISMQILDA